MLLLAAPSLAAEDASGLAYTITDGQAVIHGYAGSSGDLVIPSTIENCPVIIEDLAFWGYDQLTSVFIAPGVTRIGEGAFCECSSLTWAVVPPSIQEIRPGTFQACTSLSWFEIPRSVRVLGAYAFNICTALKQIQIPGTVEEIGPYAFNRCAGLSSVSIAEGTRRIGECAFAVCPKLSAVSLPASLTELAPDVFRLSNPHIRFAGTRRQWEALTAGLEGYEDLQVSCTDDLSAVLWAADGAGFEITDGEVRGIGIGTGSSFTSVGEMAAGLMTAPGCSLEILVPPSAQPEADAPVATGTTVCAFRAGALAAEATVIVMGDVCGTGLMSIGQVVRLAQMLQEGTGSGPPFLAGDWNGNSRLDISDLAAEAALLNPDRPVRG